MIRISKISLRAAAVALAMAGATTLGYAQDNPTLTIAVAPAGIDTWPVFVGVERGIFEKHGLDLKLNSSVQSGPEANRVMAAGDAQLSATGSGPAAAAKAAGVPLTLVVLFSGGYKNDDLNALVAREGSGIRADHLDDLVGKRVGVTFGTTPHEQLLAAMKANNVDAAAVELSNVKPADLPIALQQSDVDAVIVWEPVVSHILATVPDSYIVVRGGGYVSGNAGVAALDDVLAGQRDAVKRFVAALAETNHWIRHNRDATAEIGTRVQPGLDLEVAKEALVHFTFDPRISQLNIKGIQEGLEFLVSQDLLASAVDVSTLVDAELINEVMDENPEYFEDLPPLSADDRIQ